LIYGEETVKKLKRTHLDQESDHEDPQDLKEDDYISNPLLKYKEEQKVENPKIESTYDWISNLKSKYISIRSKY